MCFDEWKIHKKILVGVENYPYYDVSPSFYMGTCEKGTGRNCLKKHPQSHFVIS